VSQKQLKQKFYNDMAITRYNPLNDFIPSTFGSLVENMLNEQVSTEKVFMPAVDVMKDDEKLSLFVSAPGMSKENFSIDVKEHRLIISGERTLDEETAKKFIKRETRFGKFQRVFKLTDEIDVDGIGAEYKDGILRVDLPLKAKKDTSKVIEIK
jgi:HSP20 family protein